METTILIISTLLTNLLSQFLKKYVAPKYGELGVQFSVFFVACLVAGGYMAYEKIEGVKQFFLTAGAFFASAMVFYELILKRLKNVKSTEQLG